MKTLQWYAVAACVFPFLILGALLCAAGHLLLDACDAVLERRERMK